jgi:hypothetical protein
MSKSILSEESAPFSKGQIEILVTGIARNCRRTIEPSIKQIQKLFGPCVNLSYFLVESDSTDGTNLLLEKLSTKNPRFNYKSLGNLEPEIPDRIQRIAHCRNQYMLHLRDQMAKNAKFDFLLVADFDGVNSRISLCPPIERLLSTATIVSANQKGPYYDILALRAPSWVEEDYRISIANHPNPSYPFTGYLKFVSLKQRRISQGDSPIRVESAFGGLAIYPVHLLDGCKYEPKELLSGIWECEHVGFNDQAQRNGGQMIILPDLQNRGPAEHTFLVRWLPRFVLGFLAGLRARKVQ